MTGLRKLLI